MSLEPSIPLYNESGAELQNSGKGQKYAAHRRNFMFHKFFSRAWLQWGYYLSQVRETGNVHKILAMSPFRGVYLEDIKEIKIDFKKISSGNPCSLNWLSIVFYVELQ